MQSALAINAGPDHVMVERPVTSPAHAPLAVGEILAAVGEVAYDWSIGDDVIRWGANALDILGVASPERIATGRGFAALVEAGDQTSRYDAIHDGATDKGAGVQFQARYSLLPDGPGGSRRLWIEDIGRWYAGPGGRPRRAHGVLRVINDRHEREQRLAYLSRYDERTECFNRTHLLATLDKATTDADRLGRTLAFFLVSVDNLRAINEAYGFEIAEQTLGTVAQRIMQGLRRGDTIGRFSGGKLGLVLTDCDEETMRVAASRFHAAVRDEVIDIGAGSLVRHDIDRQRRPAAPWPHCQRGGRQRPGGASCRQADGQ